MISGFKTAVFDMDGTLLDSMPYWRIGAMEYLFARHLPVPDEVMNGMLLRSNRESLKMALALLGRNDSIEKASQEFVQRMERHYREDVFPKEGAKAYLEKLNRASVRCFVATATPKRIARAALDRHGMAGYFEAIFDETDMGTNKSDEKYFIRLLEKIGSSAGECVLFEDALFSIRTAKSKGIRVCGVEDYCTRNNWEEIRRIADVTIRSFEEI